MIKVFISYRSLDSAKVDKIVEQLRLARDTHGNPIFNVWQDKLNIVVGHDWWKSIVKGIIDCEIFVIMVSQKSIVNVNCLAELSYARKRNRPIIPVVLDDEYILNPETSKYDLEFWDQIPSELIDGRFQFLFYRNETFITQFTQAASLLKSSTYRDIPATQPPDPRHVNDNTNNTNLIYEQACEYAWRLELQTAEKLFQRLIDLRDPLFGNDSHDWIVVLRAYEQLLQLNKTESTRYKIPIVWEEYKKQFPKPFLQFFDPQHLGALEETNQFISDKSNLDQHNAPSYEIVLENPFDSIQSSELRMFSGQETIVSRIMSLLHDPRSTAINLVSYQQMGKTSLLNYLMRSEATSAYRYVYIDVSPVRSEEQFAVVLFRTLIKQFQGEKIRDLLKPNSMFELSMIIEDLFDIDDKQWILCIDEWDSITDYPFHCDVGRALRALNSVGRISLLVATSTNLAKLGRCDDLSGSPFYNIFNPIYLGMLDYSSTEALITTTFLRGGRTPQTSELRLLKDLSGGHPGLIKIAGQLLWEAKDEQDISNIDDQVALGFKYRAESLFADLWKQQEANGESKYMLHILGIKSNSKSVRYKGVLKTRGIIDENDNVFSKAYEEFIRENHSIEKVEDDLPA